MLTNLELDHHSTYASRLDLEHTAAEFLARARHAIVWDRPELTRLREGTVETLRRADGAAGRRRRALRVGGDRGAPGRAGRTQRPQRGRGAGRLPCRRGRRGRRGRRDSADFTGVARRFELRGRTADGRHRLRRLRPPSDRGGRHHRRRAHAVAPPRGGRLPAASVLAHRRAVARVRVGAGARPTWRSCSRSTALASAPRTIRASRARWWPGRRPRRPAGGAWAGSRQRADARAFLAGELREGDLCLTLGAGDIDELARELVA